VGQSVGLVFVNVKRILFQRRAEHFGNAIKVRITTDENIVAQFEEFIMLQLVICKLAHLQ
jgi:hypothetical protein